jgi:hypothetical protein
MKYLITLLVILCCFGTASAQVKVLIHMTDNLIEGDADTVYFPHQALRGRIVGWYDSTKTLGAMERPPEYLGLYITDATKEQVRTFVMDHKQIAVGAVDSVATLISGAQIELQDGWLHVTRAKVISILGDRVDR